MSLHVRRAGPEDAGRPIVFLHGFPFDGRMWEPQLAALPDGWRGLAPDLRGFGQSLLDDRAGDMHTGRRIGGRIARDDEPVLTMDRLADDVAALIRDEAGSRAVVCGLSMGGYVSLALWRRHPDLVEGLVLADTRAEADDDEGRENRLRTAQTARSSGARPIATGMIPGLLAPGTRADQPEVVERVRTMIHETAPATLVAALAGMAARHDSTRDLPDIGVPTLVVAGEHDALTPPDVGRAMADAIPDARFREIPGAGHVSNLENPDAFNRALRELMEEI